MSSPNFDFSRTQFYVIFSTSYVILNRGSDQFIPKFNHADVILTFPIWMMTHLIYWRIRRFEIISFSVVWRLFGISESFLEKIWVISRSYDVTVIQQGEFQKSYQSFSQMGLLQRCLATFGFVSKYKLLTTGGASGSGWVWFWGNFQIKAQQELVLETVQQLWVQNIQSQSTKV